MRRANLTWIFLLLAAASATTAQNPFESTADAQPPEARIAVGDQPADAVLQKRIESVLSEVEKFQGVAVSVNAGVVTLSGAELRPKVRKELGALVSRFDGVVYVDDRLDAAVDVENRVTSVMEIIGRYARGAVRLAPLLLVALGIVVAAGLLVRLVGAWSAPWRLLGFAPMVADVIQRLVATVVFLVGAVLALDLLDATALVGAVLGVAGVAGLAVGFAFRDIVENYLAGVLLSIRHRFSVGDHLLIQGFEGKVMRLTSREMMLMTLDGNHLSIPNSTVFKSIVCNYTRNPLRRFDFAVGIGVGEDLVKARRAGAAALREREGVMDDPKPFMRIEELGESSVNVKFFGWVDQRHADFLKVRSEAIRLVKGALDESGIDMPEPVHRVLLSRKPQQPAPPAETGDVDVARETTVDDQIREDLAKDSENLLDEDSATHGRESI